MNILGVLGSPRSSDQSATYQLMMTVLNHTGCEFELISLRGKQISGCIACLGCVKDNVCKVIDDMTPMRQAIVNADAYVIGSPNYYSTLNAHTHAFLERWFQFRHQAGNTLWGKLGVAVGAGGTDGQMPAASIETFLSYNFIETVARVSGQGAASCYSCGYGDTCEVGIPMMIHGPGVAISEDMIPDVTRQPDVMGAAARAGKLLGDRLRNGHDRSEVTGRMQAKMMEMLSHSA